MSLRNRLLFFSTRQLRPQLQPLAKASIVRISSQSRVISRSASCQSIESIEGSEERGEIRERRHGGERGRAGRAGGGGPTLYLISTRSFSASCLLRDMIIRNPRKDENGQDMMIEITPRAVNRLNEIIKEDNNPNLHLRITVESGGCHGFQYLMSLTDKIDLKDDTVFEENGAKVVLDESSLGLIKGSKVDYTIELIGSQFKIVDNPYASSSCGCGTSFDIKI